jgi:hypothetical protein
MRNEKHRAIAAAVQAAAKGSVLVLATADSQVLASQDPTKELLSQELSNFECKSCATKMTASAELQPYCITCGSEHVAKTATTAKVVANAAADKVGVQCAGCNTVMVLDSKVVTASGGHLHCSCCGSALKVQAAAESEEPAADEAPVKLESDDSDNVEEAGDMSTPEASPEAELPLEEVESSTDEWPFKEETTAAGTSSAKNIKQMLKEWNDSCEDDPTDLRKTPQKLFGNKLSEVESKVTDADWVLADPDDYDPYDSPDWVVDAVEGVHVSPDGKELCVYVSPKQDESSTTYFLFKKKGSTNASGDEWPFKEESSEKSEDEPEPAEEQKAEDEAAPKAEESASDGDADEDDLEISLPDDDDDGALDIEGELSDMEDFAPDAESELAHSEMLLKDDPMTEPSLQVPGETAAEVEAPGGENHFLESGADDTMTETPPQIAEVKDGETLADALECDDTTAGVAFTASAGRLIVLKGHVAIASLTKANAKENADMIFSSVYHAAVEHQLKKFGLRAGLNAMGFSMVRVPTLSKATVARKVQQLQQASVNKDKAREKVFASSFAIAAAGLSRGRWKGYENSLRAAVEQQLTMAGVKNARVVAARIFEQHAVPFSKSLLELASKLSAMSEDTRNEMAESLEMTTEASESVAPEIQHEDAQEASPELTVDARLMSTAALLRPSTARNIQATASAFGTAQAILDGTAPLTFGA